MFSVIIMRLDPVLFIGYIFILIPFSKWCLPYCNVKVEALAFASSSFSFQSHNIKAKICLRRAIGFMMAVLPSFSSTYASFWRSKLLCRSAPILDCNVLAVELVCDLRIFCFVVLVRFVNYVIASACHAQVHTTVSLYIIEIS